MQRFEGKSVVITGAASGIGRATARRFAAEGARTGLLDKDKFCDDDLGALNLTCDVSDQEAASHAVATIAECLGGIDVLINNAGYPVTDLDEGMSDDTWRRHFEVDVHGLRYVTEAARPWLEASRGVIVNNTSVAGLGGDRAMEAYDAAKGAAVRLTNALAIDLAPMGVRVNAVCPTLTRTPMSRSVEDQSSKLEAFERAIPLGRIGEPEEVAAVILFLASSDASFVTGVALPVDGGITAGNGQPFLG